MFSRGGRRSRVVVSACEDASRVTLRLATVDTQI